MRCGDQTEGDGIRDPFEKPRRLSRLPSPLRDVSPEPLEKFGGLRAEDTGRLDCHWLFGVFLSLLIPTRLRLPSLLLGRLALGKASSHKISLHQNMVAIEAII